MVRFICLLTYWQLIPQITHRFISVYNSDMYWKNYELLHTLKEHQLFPPFIFIRHNLSLT